LSLLANRTKKKNISFKQEGRCLAMVIAKYQNELLVVWKDPVTRNRIVIGRLWKQDDLYHFEYVRDDEDERGSIEYAIEI